MRPKVDGVTFSVFFRKHRANKVKLLLVTPKQQMCHLSNSLFFFMAAKLEVSLPKIKFEAD